MVVEILYQGNYAQGKNRKSTLKIYVYTNKSTKCGGGMPHQQLVKSVFLQTPGKSGT